MPMVFPFKAFAWTIVVLLIATVCASPASAGSRPCNAPGSARSDVGGPESTIEVTNRRSAPLSVELLDGPGASTGSLTLAPGQTGLIRTYRTGVWIGRDARRRCLSKFVSEHEIEKWDIVADTGSDYQRRDVRSFAVYVAPEFGSNDRPLLERCLKVLESNAAQLEKVVPSSAWQKLSSMAIWLEYERNSSYAGRYLGSQEWIATHGVEIARANSVQFTSHLAALEGSQLSPLAHELAHAYHDLILSHAYPEIQLAFERARASGRYNAVRNMWGSWKRAYAMENYREFFAELSEAYLGTNDFFPFTRDDLKDFDPDSYRVISQAWERPPETSPWLVRPGPWPLGRQR